MQPSNLHHGLEGLLVEGESLAHFLCPCRPWSFCWGYCLCDSLNSWCVMGIFLRNSNWGLRYGGASSPAGIIRVAVVRMGFWGFSLKRERRSAMWRQGGKCGTWWLPWISWAAVLASQGSSSRAPVMVAEVKASCMQSWAKGCAWWTFLSYRIRGGHRKVIITIIPTQGIFELIVYSPIHA